LTLRGEVDGAGYPEFARNRVPLVIHGAAPDTVRLDGTDLRSTGGHFTLPNAGTGFALEFALTED
jgi:alpha-glucosidase